MTKATVGGVPCLASSPVKWSFRDGVEAATGIFDFAPSDVEKLLGMTYVDLLIEGERKSIHVQGLSVVSEVSSGNPNIRRVMLADQRWWWRYKHVLRSFNIRRLIGVKRLTDPQTLEIQPVVDDVTFAKWSLYPREDGSRKWLASEVVADVLAAVLPSGFSVPCAEGFDEQPIENLELDDSGDAAVARVLSYLPGAAITVGADGQARIYSRLSGADQMLVARAGDEIEGGGHIQYISRRHIRPSAINVLFTVEYEVRFDFEELESKTGSIAEADEERIIDNVLPAPDFQTTLSSGETVAQGTWLSFPVALSAWGEAPYLGDIDFEDIQRAMVPFIDLWSTVRLAGQFAPVDEPADWASRVASIQQHYRQTFRIRREWMDRIKHLRAYRVALLDVETGTRGPAVAYADFAYMSTVRSLWAEANSNADLSYATNVLRYPRGDGGKIGRRDAPCPARVSVIDEDEGVLRLDYIGDPFGVHTTVLPSLVELEGTGHTDGTPDDAGPTADFASARCGGSIAYNAISESGAYPKLSASHKVAVILTAIPGAPNSNEQLFGIRVTPSEISGMLPPAAALGIADSNGPEMTIRIPASVETARVPWLDDDSEKIETAFGVRTGPRPDLSDMIINIDAGGFSAEGGAAINSIARAAAARIYAAMADRPEGGATFDLDPSVELGGWMEDVTHDLGVDGKTFTLVALPQGETPEFSMLSLLPAGVRATVLKLARPGKD